MRRKSFNTTVGYTREGRLFKGKLSIVCVAIAGSMRSRNR